MPLDFPASPTNGQTYGQYTYDATKGAWRVIGVSGTSVISSATPPASPIAGNLWFNTNDGVLFTYFNDGDTSQWVEVKSNTASGSTVAARVDTLEAKPNGLVNVIPSNVVVSSGSASTGATGLVTFTGVTGISLNNVFTTAYERYRIVVKAQSTGASNDHFFRYRVNNGDIATGYYGATLYNAYNVAVTTVNQQSNGTWAWIAYWGNIGGGLATIEALPTSSYSSLVNDSYVPSNAAQYHGGYNTTTATKPDGFTLYAGTAFTGTVQVYGYR